MSGGYIGGLKKGAELAAPFLAIEPSLQEIVLRRAAVDVGIDGPQVGLDFALLGLRVALHSSGIVFI